METGTAQLTSRPFLFSAARCLISSVVKVVNWTWFLLLVGECKGSVRTGLARRVADLLGMESVLQGWELLLRPRVAVLSSDGGMLGASMGRW